MNRNIDLAEVVAGRRLLTIDCHIFLLSVVVGAEVLSFDELLEMDEVFGAAACREVTHDYRHSFHVVDCQIRVRYRQKKLGTH